MRQRTSQAFLGSTGPTIGILLWNSVSTSQQARAFVPVTRAFDLRLMQASASKVAKVLCCSFCTWQVFACQNECAACRATSTQCEKIRKHHANQLRSYALLAKPWPGACSYMPGAGAKASAGSAGRVWSELLKSFATVLEF